MNSLDDNFKLLKEQGFKVAPYKIVHKSKTAFDAAEELGFPVVLKLASNIHKKDVGGVITNLHNHMDISDAWTRINKNVSEAGIKTDEFMVQKQVKGTELIVGLKDDRIFGPVIMLGSGGTFTEVLRDVTFRVCPISLKDAEEMIAEIKSYEMLKGVRGDKPSNLEDLKNLLFSLSRFHKRIEFREVDLNPVFVNSDGAFIADARIIT